MARNIEYSDLFHQNFRNLCITYIKDSNTKASTYDELYYEIKEYCNKNNLNCFGYQSFKNWHAEPVPGSTTPKSLPDTYNICIITEFFGCDANYLFCCNEFSPDLNVNGSLSRIDNYIYETYGLEKSTLDALRKYKDCGIDSITYADSPHNSVQPEYCFSKLLNLLIQKTPWLIVNLLQIIYADEIGLCDRGTLDTIDDPINDQYKRTNDIDVSLSLLSMRVKKLLENPTYMPNKLNPLETYDKELVNSDSINEYLAGTVKTRLSRLNDELNLICSSDSIDMIPPI